MAANPRSLQLTELYRRRLLATRSRVEREAQVRWPTIGQLDQTGWPAEMAQVVGQAQKEAVRATAGYLSAYATLETGKRQTVRLDSGPYAGLSRDGRGLAEALGSPIIGTLGKLKDGADPTEALSYGLNRARRMVGVDFDHAHRTALLEALDRDERFGGWQRAVRGTCGACAALATGPQDGLRFEVHPACQCVSEPVVKPLLDDFRRAAKKGDKVEAAAGQEYKNGKWSPVEGPVRGRVVKADENTVMLQLGSGSKTRYIAAQRGSISPFERARSAQQVLRENLGQNTKMFPLEERQAMLDYTGGKGSVAEDMNRSLRKGAGDVHSDVRDALDSAFGRVPGLPEEGVVYRGTKVTGARGLKVGSEITDQGFMSTSPVRRVGEDFTAFSGGDLFEVTLPKGTKALDMNSAAGSRFGKEREILLPRGTRMVVESIEPHPTRRGSRIIKVRVIQ